MSDVQNIVVIGASVVGEWRIIEELMLDQPTEWFSLDNLIKVSGVGGVRVKSVQNMIWKAARCGVLKVAGSKGKRMYRLADTFTVAVYVSGRNG